MVHGKDNGIGNLENLLTADERAALKDSYGRRPRLAFDDIRDWMFGSLRKLSSGRLMGKKSDQIKRSLKLKDGAE